MHQTVIKFITLTLLLFTIFSCAHTMTSDSQSLLPTQSNVLVVLAHPDDETWMSGTLARLNAEGHSVQVVYASSGDKGRDASGAGLSDKRLANAREQEAIRALKSLGINSAPIFLRFTDGQLDQYRDEMTQRLSTAITPETQLIISFGDRGITGHPDHIAVKEASEMLYRKLKKQGSKTMLWQAIFSENRNRIAIEVAETLNHPFRIRAASANTLIGRTIDVSNFQTQRLAAFKQHKTQFPASMHELWREFLEKSSAEEFYEFDSDNSKNL